jgi:hypothetical protein
MEIVPPSLNIPLERKERWGLRLLVACIGVVVVSTFVSPAFAIVFAAASIVGLPVFWLLFFSAGFSAKLNSLGMLGRFVFYAVLFSYIALSKTVLVPIVVGVIERVVV